MCSEWAVNIQRDSYASYVGHNPILAYFAIAENESIGREHYNFMQVFISYISVLSMLDNACKIISTHNFLVFLQVFGWRVSSWL